MIHVYNCIYIYIHTLNVFLIYIYIYYIPAKPHQAGMFTILTKLFVFSREARIPTPVVLEVEIPVLGQFSSPAAICTFSKQAPGTCHTVTHNIFRCSWHVYRNFAQGLSLVAALPLDVLTT